MLKAIETQYKGYRFRSRLEARWAVFFDALGLKWEYEPEGFDLGNNTWYLPDFRVTSPQGLVAWYEVKPEGVTADAKFELFERRLDHLGVHRKLLSGDPLHFARPDCVCPRCGAVGSASGGVYWSAGGHEKGLGIYCWPCDTDTPGGGGNDAEIGFLGQPVVPHKGDLLIDWADYKMFSDRVTRAGEKARQARFEYGAVV